MSTNAVSTHLESNKALFNDINIVILIYKHESFYWIFQNTNITIIIYKNPHINYICMNYLYDYYYLKHIFLKKRQSRVYTFITQSEYYLMI